MLGYIYLAYPLGTAWLSRHAARPVQRAEFIPSVTLLIPAYNEVATIADKIEASLALDYPSDRLEIVVITDGSDDRTPDIVAGYAARGVRLLHQPRRQGKAAAINRALPVLQSDIVVFTDANAMVEPGALRALVRPFADPSVGGVAGEKRVRGGGEGLYWRYESALKRWDSAWGSAMGAAGELFAIRRSLFEPPPSEALIEDFVISLRLVERGWRVVYEPEAVVVEEPSPTLAGEWRRRTRIAAGGFQTMGWLSGLLQPSRGRVAWAYLSHRVLRWAVAPFLLPLLYGCTLGLWQISLYRWAGWAQTAFYAAALLGYLLARHGVHRGPLQAAFYVCFTHAAALVGLWRYLAGTQPVTWAKAR